MIHQIKRRLFKEKHEILNVPIKSCIHYCGFKYGGQQYNPYETFISRYYNEPGQIEDIKKQFIDFLRYYHPQSINDAFGLNLSKQYPLWAFPWQNHQSLQNITNWVNDPDNIVDILTHFCEKGIPSYKIDQEFYWLTRALKEMQYPGYNPDKFSYVEALKFEALNGNMAYLLLDGNHRVSALHTLGQATVKIKIRSASIVREIDVKKWPNVKNGSFTAADALLIFNNYFTGNSCYKTSDVAAGILDYTNHYSYYI